MLKTDATALSAFKSSLSAQSPPVEFTPALTALWWAAKDKWDKAHAIVMDEPGRDSAWVHAYLHRVEGDLDNAGYWYKQAGQPASSAALESEWASITSELLARSADH